jgi:FAD:protein FMN transferase
MKTQPVIAIQYFHCSSMGTRFDFLTYGIDEELFNTLRQQITQELERIESKFSRFSPLSEIYHINNYASSEEVVTDEETFALINLCKTYYLKTSSLFDITVGKKTEIAFQPQTIDTIEPANTIPHFDSSLLGTDKIITNATSTSIKFTNPFLSIDLGGIGKGYALERIKNLCYQCQITNVFISFGESSIITLGKHPHGNYWPIGIQHAFNPGPAIYTCKLNDNSMSTSGNSSNNKIKFGDNGHIFNPKTGKFENAAKSVSVVCQSAIEAEVLSTALFIASENERNEILNRFSFDEIIQINYDKSNNYTIINL